MGLYGVLVVTTPATGSAAAQAYTGVSYDADAALLFSEIDPVQNRAVATAVSTPGFLETRVWSGQVGQCGNPAAPAGIVKTCYPPAVNYDPRYYLINGVSFDKSQPALSALPILAPASAGGTVAAGNGRVLLRLVNAGLRMHVPAVVGRNLTLFAEDGNLLPGTPRVQTDVFLAAGKTYDVGIQPAQSAGNYTPATYALYDRQLSLSTNNQRDGGMLAYLNVAGATTGAGTAASATTVVANPDSYFLVAGNALTISDSSKGLIANDVGVYGVSVLAAPTGAGSTLTLNADGTFNYVPGAGVTSDSFSYCANVAVVAGTPPTCSGKSATVTLAACTGSCLGVAPTATADAYTSNIATRLLVGSPGVLENDSDPSGLALTVDTATVTPGAGLSVKVETDGSFSASVASAGTYSFTYHAKNSQGSASGVATVTLTFQPASHVGLKVVDAKSGAAIEDYRWIIEEDRTFWVEPRCQVNSTTASGRLSAASGAEPGLQLPYRQHAGAWPRAASARSRANRARPSSRRPPSPATSATACAAPTRDQKVPVTPDQVHLDPEQALLHLGAAGRRREPGDQRCRRVSGRQPPVRASPPTAATTTRPTCTGCRADRTAVTRRTSTAAVTRWVVRRYRANRLALGASANITVSLQETPLPDRQGDGVRVRRRQSAQR